MKGLIRGVFLLFILLSIKQSIHAQGIALFTGYDDLDEAIYLGLGTDIFEFDYSTWRLGFMTIEVGFSEEVIKSKLGLYFYLVYLELGYQTYGLSIGGSGGITSGITDSFEETAMQLIYDVGANLQLGPVLMGYGYGWDEFHEFEYNFVRLGIKFDI